MDQPKREQLQRVLVWVLHSVMEQSRVLELHAFLAELVGRFEFKFTGSAGDFRREACNLMTPTLKSEREKGSQLPVRVRMARSEEM